MGSVNKVILVGNLGRDAELRYTPGGAAVATLNMATTEVWNDKAGQRQEKTEWHRIVVWGRSAESLTDLVKVAGVTSRGSYRRVSGRTRMTRSGSPRRSASSGPCCSVAMRRSGRSICRLPP